MSKRGEDGNCFTKIEILTFGRSKEEDAKNPVALFRGDAFRVTESGVEQFDEGLIVEIPVK